jgi:hypothetical protein
MLISDDRHLVVGVPFALDYSAHLELNLADEALGDVEKAVSYDLWVGQNP